MYGIHRSRHSNKLSRFPRMGLLPLAKNLEMVAIGLVWICRSVSKTAKWTYMIFSSSSSEGVTIFQMLVLIFYHTIWPRAAAKEFMWPKIELYNIDGNVAYWSLLGNQVLYKDGEPIIGGGLGYLAFKIATFSSVNNSHFKETLLRSHGNPWYQAMWYFIGWVLINLGCDALITCDSSRAYYFPPEIMWLKDILAMISQRHCHVHLLLHFLVIFR